MRVKKISLLLSFIVCLTFVFAGVGTPKIAMANTDVSDVRDVYSDTWSLTDELGRKAPTYSETGGIKSKKKVGIFYLVWHDKLISAAVKSDKEAPRNISKIIRDNPENFIYDASLYGPVASMQYWGEPLYGYYNLRYDNDVVRKHAIQLTDAGVDFVVIDATNFYIGSYNELSDDVPTITNICDEYVKMRSEGLKTPEITFMFTWEPKYNGNAINYFYDKLYSKPEYEDLWFKREGKPLILGHPDYVKEEIRDNFSYRRVQPEVTEVSGGSWNWLAKYPQEIGTSKYNVKEMMSVGVAQNWTDKLSFMSSIDEYGRFNARGRSWTTTSSKLLKNPTSEEYQSQYGYNFQEQFDRAINIDPDMLFVTAWNEWIAGRFDKLPDWAGGGALPNKANFCDDYTTEFSREVEMTREGGLNDNFYNQLAENIRMFKGVRKAPVTKTIKTISVDGDFGDWKDIPDYFRDPVNDKTNRDANSFGQVRNGEEVRYVNKSGRNDFVDAKISRDNENLYFYVSTVDTITPYTDANWMRLFIKTGGEKNYNGFDYVVNRTAPGQDKAVLEKSKGGYNWETVSDSISYKVSGNQMELCIPLANLNLDASNVHFEFKWDDNIQIADDPLSWYTDGDTAPNSRFNYNYFEEEQNDEFTSYRELYDFYVPTDQKDYMVFQSPEDTAGVKFESKTDFRGIDIAAFNFMNERASYTLKLYKFDTSFSKSIMSEPILTRVVDNAYNNTPMYIGAGLIPKGEYLLVVSDVKTSGENTVGLNTFIGQGQTVAYQNGYIVKDVCYQLRIHSYLNQVETAQSAAYNGQDAAALIDRNASTVWTSKSFDTKNIEEEVVLDLGESKDLIGMRLTPNIVNGEAKGFPVQFSFEVSDDGVNYTPIQNQMYIDYVATATNQDFRFNVPVTAKYVKVKMYEANGSDGAYTVQLSDIDALSGGNYAKAAEETKGGCGSSVGGTVGVGVSAIIVLAAATMFVKKQKN